MTWVLACWLINMNSRGDTLAASIKQKCYVLFLEKKAMYYSTSVQAAR